MVSNEELLYDFEIKDESSDYLSDIENSKIVRHIQWLNTKNKIYKNIEKCALCVSIMGIPLMHKIHKTNKKIKKYRKFREEVATVIPPSKDIKIMIKESTKSFNHIIDYMIYNGIIWYRRRNGQCNS